MSGATAYAQGIVSDVTAASASVPDPNTAEAVLARAKALAVTMAANPSAAMELTTR
jgi:hypothetical protein